MINSRALNPKINIHSLIYRLRWFFFNIPSNRTSQAFQGDGYGKIRNSRFFPPKRNFHHLERFSNITSSFTIAVDPREKRKTCAMFAYLLYCRQQTVNFLSTFHLWGKYSVEIKQSLFSERNSTKHFVRMDRSQNFSRIDNFKGGNSLKRLRNICSHFIVYEHPSKHHQKSIWWCTETKPEQWTFRSRNSLWEFVITLSISAYTSDIV